MAYPHQNKRHEIVGQTHYLIEWWNKWNGHWEAVKDFKSQEELDTDLEKRIKTEPMVLYRALTYTINISHYGSRVFQHEK